MDDFGKIKATILENGVKFSVKIIPNSSFCEISGVIDNSLKIKIASPPIDGKANEKLVKYLSKLFGVTKSSIKIVSGETSKNKVVFIQGNTDKIMKILKIMKIIIL